MALRLRKGIKSDAKAACELGLRKFDATIPCGNCGTTECYSSNGNCVHCTHKATKDRRKKMAMSTQVEGNAAAVASTVDQHGVATVEQMVVVPRADPPREMTFLQRRAILSEIEVVYVDEKTGYSKGWSDKRISDKLKMPLAWVRRLREDNFGPETVIDFVKISSEVDDVKAAHEEFEARYISLRSKQEAIEVEMRALFEESKKIGTLAFNLGVTVAELQAR